MKDKKSKKSEQNSDVSVSSSNESGSNSSQSSSNSNDTQSTEESQSEEDKEKTKLIKIVEDFEVDPMREGKLIELNARIEKDIINEGKELWFLSFFRTNENKEFMEHLNNIMFEYDSSYGRTKDEMMKNMEMFLKHRFNIIMELELLKEIKKIGRELDGVIGNALGFIYSVDMHKMDKDLRQNLKDLRNAAKNYIPYRKGNVTVEQKDKKIRKNISKEFNKQSLSFHKKYQQIQKSKEDTVQKKIDAYLEKQNINEINENQKYDTDKDGESSEISDMTDQIPEKPKENEEESEGVPLRCLSKSQTAFFIFHLIKNNMIVHMEHFLEGFFMNISTDEQQEFIIYTYNIFMNNGYLLNFTNQPEFFNFGEYHTVLMSEIEKNRFISNLTMLLKLYKEMSSSKINLMDLADRELYLSNKLTNSILPDIDIQYDEENEKANLFKFQDILKDMENKLRFLANVHLFRSTIELIYSQVFGKLTDKVYSWFDNSNVAIQMIKEFSDRMLKDLSQTKILNEEYQYFIKNQIRIDDLEGSHIVSVSDMIKNLGLKMSEISHEENSVSKHIDEFFLLRRSMINGNDELRILKHPISRKAYFEYVQRTYTYKIGGDAPEGVEDDVELKADNEMKMSVLRNVDMVIDEDDFSNRSWREDVENIETLLSGLDFAGDGEYGMQMSLDMEGISDEKKVKINSDNFNEIYKTREDLKEEKTTKNNEETKKKLRQKLKDFLKIYSDDDDDSQVPVNEDKERRLESENGSKKDSKTAEVNFGRNPSKMKKSNNTWNRMFFDRDEDDELM